MLLLHFFLSFSSLCFKQIYFDSIWHIKQIPGKSTTNLPQTMKLPNVMLAFENYYCTTIHAASIWLLLIFVLGWAGAAAAALLHLFQSSQLFYIIDFSLLSYKYYIVHESAAMVKKICELIHPDHRFWCAIYRKAIWWIEWKQFFFFHNICRFQ